MIKHLQSVRFKSKIEKMVEIACHPEATHYSLGRGKINFYQVNPQSTEKMKQIPRGTNVIEFPEFRRFRSWIYYGEPAFRGHSLYNKYF